MSSQMLSPFSPYGKKEHLLLARAWASSGSVGGCMLAACDGDFTYFIACIFIPDFGFSTLCCIYAFVTGI